jgi:hypothetical protein
MKRCILLLPLLILACEGKETAPLRAFQAKSRNELVGGPVAYADTGDFVLENDKVRVAILDQDRSWGPGVFGGSLVDADVRRDDALTPPGSGRDRFVEIFPFANLLVPTPKGTDVRVLKDGSDGKEAVVRVEGEGRYMFEVMAVLRNMRPNVLDNLFPIVRTAMRFRTDYIVRPGDAHVTMKTWLLLGAEPPGTVPSQPCKDNKTCADGLTCVNGACACKPLNCPEKCAPFDPADADSGRALDPATYCLQCKCADPPAPMKLADGSQSVFGTILGDSVAGKVDPATNKILPKEVRAGVGAGDFVFFGNQNDIFVPGHGFDEEKPIWDALFSARDTFQQPLAFDFVAAAGGDVSYAYFLKKRQSADTDPKVLVPIFTSAATAFIAATLNCKWDESDDATCESARVYEFERYLAIGQGDIGSVADTVWRVRGTPTGRVEGWVRWQETGAAAHKAAVFVLHNPDPSKAWASLDDIVAANRAQDPERSDPGVVLHWDADVGLDRRLDGRFTGTLPEGKYVVVAMDQHRIVYSAPVPLHVTAGQRYVIAPALPTPARLRVRAVDQGGEGLPCKATVVGLGADGKPLFRDGGRRPYLGQGRLGEGVQHIGFAMDGRFDVPVPAGKYRVTVSRGVEYGIGEREVEVQAGDVKVWTEVLRREVDTAGWVSGDFHLHAEPSFDSGMPLGQRVATVAAEGLDYVASTDHDVASDYGPYLKLAGLQPWLKTAVGSEVSTLEIGHFIGFPLQYDALQVPHHGSVDWFCKGSDGILDDILSKTALPKSDGAPTSIVAHPRDGFLGWAEQAEIDAYTLTRKPPGADDPPGNPVLRTVGCHFDAMEVFNGKRFDLIQTPTVREVQTFWRCLYRIDGLHIEKDGQLDDAGTRAALKATCPELAGDPVGDPAAIACPDSDTLPECKMRVRMGVARAVSSQILRRTPEEQAAWLHLVDGKSAKAGRFRVQDLDKTFCGLDLAKLGKALDEAYTAEQLLLPCTRWVGSLSDYFRMLEHGFVKTQVGGSDSHGYKIEPGAPRNWIKATADAPGAISAGEVSRNLRKGQVIASYGPFVDVRVLGGGPGDTVMASAGKIDVKVKVQTASWFGIDRVEIYRNGDLVLSEDVSSPVSSIVDVDKTYRIDVPAGRDGWIVVVASGTKAERLMRPVYLDIPFGELQLARVTSLALKNILIPGVPNPFPEPPRIPDFTPVYPYAMTNAVLIDLDGNGKYDAPLPFPGFCSQPCDPATAKMTAGPHAGKTCDAQQDGYKCLDREKKCGFDIPGVCDVYATKQSALGFGHVQP